MIRIFIGYDEGEKIAFHVLSESIRRLSSEPVSIVPLDLNTIKNHFIREKQSNQSTEFAFSRFLVPYLSNYEGWSIFMDCDMMVRTDINTLWNMRDDDYAVMCCQHDYEPKQNVKFRGAKNEKFEKKNWSSMMLFHNTMCTKLTPEYVNTASGLELHQFKWLPNDYSIGKIPLEWNWLVGEYEHNSRAKNVHFTLGGPYFKDYKDCDYSNEWYSIYNDMKRVDL